LKSIFVTPKHPLIIHGAGGQSRVLFDIARACNIRVECVLDDTPAADSFEGVPVFLARTFDFARFQPFLFIVGIGANSIRSDRFCELRSKGNPATLIHPFSFVSPAATIGSGTAIMPGVVINSGARVGVDCIINTSASIDHDCLIGPHSHLCPGVRLAGSVVVGAGTMIGTGCAVIPGVKIGNNCMIGAGSVVVRNLPDNSVAFGNPARLVRQNEPFSFDESE
jgi:sugar O-acyltransferase (sialic acid O-acetyltransferase NeuD family)